ncbi:uncharacterized protein [Antedon mediterranea]|uniref:uncharacterized protein n=1 Tax=Antedon mediterranea TaxID=105859 RepID=UPI003AF952B1
MPNSGYQGQINYQYCGTAKRDVGKLPVGEKYYQGNLPNPAFWCSYVSRPAPPPSAKNSLPPINNKYSRHLNRGGVPTPDHGAPVTPKVAYNCSGRVPKGGFVSNSVAPFTTLGKPTCGFFFSRQTDHKKRQTGIPPANLVMWRYYLK